MSLPGGSGIRARRERSALQMGATPSPSWFLATASSPPMEPSGGTAVGWSVRNGWPPTMRRSRSNRRTACTRVAPPGCNVPGGRISFRNTGRYHRFNNDGECSAGWRHGSWTPESASEKMMIKRRDVLLAAASHGLAFWSVAAFGQTTGKEQKKARPPRSRRMIERQDTRSGSRRASPAGTDRDHHG